MWFWHRMDSLIGRVALLTGASGIAATTSLRLASAGAAVTVVADDAARLTAFPATADARAITGHPSAVHGGRFVTRAALPSEDHSAAIEEQRLIAVIFATTVKRSTRTRHLEGPVE
jgi:NAD(P)-dependent dehydrogenase (short-subunit alcohol dehydrogenase family)